jgi:murein DD-endopeptidase MepM/ murein hydrolase activator NlpD
VREGLAIEWDRLRPQLRGIALALTGFGLAGCSAEPAHFNGDARSQTSPASAAQPTFGKVPGGYWSWDGGIAITVARGDSVDGIARRHHVPASVIIQANNLNVPIALRPGQHLVVPRYSTSPIPVASPPLRPAVAALIPPGSIPANDAAADVARGPEGPADAPESSPNKISRHANGVSPTVAKALPQKKPAVEQHATRPAAPEPPPAKPAGQKAEVQPIKTADAAPRFHWPVRGEVIAGFGPKADGQRNDGIDIAVPENTPIKAADDGVVIYSGNQLKAFGNLVLVRHSNNYVSVYAHAKELRVKQGDQIKVGAIIGMSGQTGNVGTPLVHFEIRQGSTPVDPMRLLHGA